MPAAMSAATRCRPPPKRVADAVVHRRAVAGRRLAHEVGAVGRRCAPSRAGNPAWCSVVVPRAGQRRRARASARRCPRGGSAPGRRRRAASACRCARPATATLPILTIRLRVVGSSRSSASASQPAERLAGVGHAGVPVAHRREVRQARTVVAAAVHDGHACRPCTAARSRPSTDGSRSRRATLSTSRSGMPMRRPRAVVGAGRRTAPRCSGRRCRPRARARRGSARDASRRSCPAAPAR